VAVSKRNVIASGVLAAAVIAFVAYVVVSNRQLNQYTSPTSSSVSTTPIQESKDTITIKNTSVSDKGYGITEVVGEATNNSSTKHSATLKATFYSADGKIIGTASGVVNDISPNDTKTFNLMTTDSIAGYSSFKVQIDSLI